MANTNHYPSRDTSSQLRRGLPWHVLERFHWVRSSWFGYLASVLLIGGLLVVEKLDEYLPQASIFIGAPFALVSILVALIWGLGPALVSIILGLMTLAYFISSDIFTSNLLEDLELDGLFILVQLFAVAVVVQLERFHRKLEAAYQALTAAYQELATAHDELEVTRQRLVENNQQLEQANRLKEYVITRAAHELRTPLTTILGRTQLLRTRLKKAEHVPIERSTIQRDLEMMEVRVLHLRALVESLFDLSRAQSFQSPSQRRLVDIGALCHKAVADQRTLSGHIIELDLPPQPLLVHANEECIAQMLFNLVQNAIKYASERSSIQISAASDGPQITLRVHNECQDLAPEQLEHFFEPFYRTPEVEYSSLPGWGLGLAICKEIVERYGGHIWAEYAERKDLTLVVTFPSGSLSTGKQTEASRA